MPSSGFFTLLPDFVLGLSWALTAVRSFWVGDYILFTSCALMVAYHVRCVAIYNLLGVGKKRVTRQQIYWVDAVLAPPLLMVGSYSAYHGYTWAGGCGMFVGLLCLKGVFEKWDGKY